MLCLVRLNILLAGEQGESCTDEGGGSADDERISRETITRRTRNEVKYELTHFKSLDSPAPKGNI